VAGAGAGIYASVRARRVKEAFTADGLSDRWHALTLGARMFRDEVAQGQAEAETELRERFGLVPHGRRELGAGQHRAVVSTGSTDAVVSTGSTDAVVSTGSTDGRTQEGDS
jgi:hypothetical protein